MVRITRPHPHHKSPSCQDWNRPCERGGILFITCHVTSRHHEVKELFHFMGSSSFSKSPPCQVWWPYALQKRRYYVFNFSRNSRDQGVMQSYRWFPLIISHHLANFSGHRFWQKRRYYIFNLSRDLTWPRDQRVGDIMGGCPSL